MKQAIPVVQLLLCALILSACEPFPPCPSSHFHVYNLPGNTDDRTRSLFEQDVVLRAHPHGGADAVKVSANVPPVNVGRARCWRVQTSQNGPVAKNKNRESAVNASLMSVIKVQNKN